MSTTTRRTSAPADFLAASRRVKESQLHRDLKTFVADAERLIDEAFLLADRVAATPPAVNPFGACPGTNDEGMIGEAVGELQALARTVNNAVAFFRSEL